MSENKMNLKDLESKEQVEGGSTPKLAERKGSLTSWSWGETNITNPFSEKGVNTDPVLSPVSKKKY